jgi:hypothetical protein
MTEYFRRDGPGGSPADTQFKFVSRWDPQLAMRRGDPYASDEPYYGFPAEVSPPGRERFSGGHPLDRRPYGRDPYEDDGPAYEPPMIEDHERYQRRPRRVDPDYFFWRRPAY